MTSPVITIARKELLELTRDGRFRWTGAIVLSLLLAAFLAGWRSYQDVRAQHESAQHAQREMWVNQPAKNPHSAAHYGLWAFKPKMPLSFVDRGVDPYVGVASYLEAHKQNEFRYRPAMDATAVQRFGEWTAASVLQLLIPLLIVVLAFPAFAGEREQGTLRQLASVGVRARDLALGKAAGTAGALALLLVPAAALGVAALALTADGGALAGDVPRMALMTLTYLAYFAVFVAVTLAVSARAPSARVALLALLAFWTLNTLVAPRAMTDVARRLYPTPSAFDFATRVARDLERGFDGHTPDRRLEMLRDSVLREYQVARVESLPFNFDAMAMQRGEEAGDRVFDAHYGALYDRYRQQNAVHQLGALLAPMLAVRSLSMALAGTDVEQHRAFAEAAERYRRVLVKRMNDEMAANSRTGDWDWKADPSLWREVPAFSYAAPRLAAVLAHQGWSVATLLLWVVMGVAVVARTSKLRVT
jgi:ABC-2 type transport system permease protein